MARFTRRVGPSAAAAAAAAAVAATAATGAAMTIAEWPRPLQLVPAGACADRCDLVGVVDQPRRRLTVFAPTDAAFVSLGAGGSGYVGEDKDAAFDAIVSALTRTRGGRPDPDAHRHPPIPRCHGRLAVARPG
eukprot:TRINITY_DN14070_c0_g1_i1.p2 TRINITY_DN14070_c0_g1~~TRINITY_DN14070_c0_g1_i1.p2  ORF type:complete len:148 (-),score=28.02 TRINITY_DN14070_c0_g1_i1:509-907(-)